MGVGREGQGSVHEEAYTGKLRFELCADTTGLPSMAQRSPIIQKQGIPEGTKDQGEDYRVAG